VNRIFGDAHHGEERRTLSGSAPIKGAPLLIGVNVVSLFPGTGKTGGKVRANRRLPDTAFWLSIASTGISESP
jgi:hypothetical protein